MNFIQEQLGRLIYPAENVSQKTDQQPIKKTPQEDPLVLRTALNEDPRPIGVTDIDLYESSKYIQHNMAYLTYLEGKQLPASGAEVLANAGVKPSWRLVLVDWLYEVKERLGVLPDTYFITIALLDRFYDQLEDKIPKADVQKSGVVALFLAAKYEEIYPPSIYDLAEICDRAYTVEELKAYEIKMLAELSFDMSQPYSLQFLRRYVQSIKDRLEGETYTSAKYLLELSVLEPSLIGTPFSITAAAALKLSMNLCQPDLKWDNQLSYWSGLSEDDIQETVATLSQLHEEAKIPSRKFHGCFKRNAPKLPKYLTN